MTVKQAFEDRRILVKVLPTLTNVTKTKHFYDSL